MIFLAGVTHDVRSNTLEATWLEELFDMDRVLTGYRQVKCRNYSSEQKAEFEADVEGGAKYTAMAEWPDAPAAQSTTTTTTTP